MFSYLYANARERAINNIRISIEFWESEKNGFISDRNQYCSELVYLVETGNASQTDIEAYNRLINQCDEEAAKCRKEIKKLKRQLRVI